MEPEGRQTSDILLSRCAQQVAEPGEGVKDIEAIKETGANCVEHYRAGNRCVADKERGCTAGSSKQQCSWQVCNLPVNERKQCKLDQHKKIACPLVGQVQHSFQHQNQYVKEQPCRGVLPQQGTPLMPACVERKQVGADRSNQQNGGDCFQDGYSALVGGTKGKMLLRLAK